VNRANAAHFASPRSAWYRAEARIESTVMRLAGERESTGVSLPGEREPESSVGPAFEFDTRT